MIETIKQIGLFMIVAQTLMHFAAGQQYEKYIKVIAGVIVLLLFLNSFGLSGNHPVGQWEREMSKIADDINGFSSQWTDEMMDTDYGTMGGVTQQLEEEMKQKLNSALRADPYAVTEVSVEWETKGGMNEIDVQGMAVRNIKITLRQTRNEEIMDQEGDDAFVDSIVIDRIQIGTDSQPDELMPEGGESRGKAESGAGRQEGESGTGQGEEKGQLGEYRRLFAGILGVEEEKVEVLCDGGR